MSTSSGSRVRRLGTMAMSSKPYALRPDLPMPISSSATRLAPWVRRGNVQSSGWVVDSSGPEVAERRDREVAHDGEGDHERADRKRRPPPGEPCGRPPVPPRCCHRDGDDGQGEDVERVEVE